jgi:hypothetical protein
MDSDYREVSITAVDTPTPLIQQGADTPNAFVVPAGAKRITEIIITAIPNTADDANLGFSCGIHIYGDGVKLPSGWFLGPTGSVEGAATMSGAETDNEVQRYLTNIPVVSGGSFSVDGFMLGEDIGALHMIVDIVYDGLVVGKIVDMDYRTQDLTAANALVTLNERGAAVAEGDFKPAGKTIGELFIGMGAKITGAATTVVGFAVHLSGTGLIVSGYYKFTGRGIALRSDAVSGNSVKSLMRYQVGISTKRTGDIRAQAQMIEGDVGTAFAVVGFAYY